MKKLFTSIFIACSMSLFAQNVNIPDANFKNALIEQGVDTNKDGEIQKSEAVAVTKLTINSNFLKDKNNRISIDSVSVDLSFLVNLQVLNISQTNITHLNISKNILLDTVICDSNYISVLDISNNKVLIYLSCSNNFLKELDATQNSLLVYLNCAQNQLTKLLLNDNSELVVNQRIANNTELTSLDCSSNQLMSLDVSKNMALIYLHCDKNPNLNTVFVPSVFEANANIDFVKDDFAVWAEPTITSTTQNTTQKSSILKAYNLQGKEIPVDTKGQMIILLYSDGTTEKVFKD